MAKVQNGYIPQSFRDYLNDDSQKLGFVERAYSYFDKKIESEKGATERQLSMAFS